MLEELTGRRVALRHRIASDGSDGPRFTDAVGELAADGRDAVVVHTRGGPVRVLRDAVVAVREVPPAPPRRASWAAVNRIERLRAAAWPSPVREDVGEWRLRAAGGFTNRANSALVLGDPGVPLVRALDRLREFSAEQGIDPVVQAPVGSPWSNRILEAGWHVLPAWGGQCLVLVAPTGSADGAPDWPAAPGDGWWAVHGVTAPAAESPAWSVLTAGAPGARGGEQSKGAGVAPPGEQSKGGGERDRPSAAGPREDAVTVGFGVLDGPDGAPAAAVRAAVVDDHVYLARLHVRAEHRRRGLGARLTEQALTWGAAHGARHAMLDVAGDNTAALALYEREGWRVHHRYHYLVPTPP
ncbi:GNAT family N-acetyltransferase [Pseudonocardia nematodicida]|uniref:GNAT family N-acetyltransferase n=1 Tax=Pseudonocardia nematodicida TaxID=1206997 RepID=A0ABV1KAR9_9PSEU